MLFLDYIAELALHFVGGGAMPTLPSPWCYLVPICLIALGIFEGLFGKKFYKLQIYLAGFTFGATVGTTLVGFIQSLNWFTMPDILPLIIILVLGIVGLLLLTRIIRIGIFMCGGVVFFFVVNFITGSLIFSLIGFVVGGIVALLMENTMMAISTSLAGGFLVIYGGVRSLIPIAMNGWLCMALALVLSVGFMFFQFKRRKS